MASNNRASLYTPVKEQACRVPSQSQWGKTSPKGDEDLTVTVPELGSVSLNPQAAACATDVLFDAEAAEGGALGVLVCQSIQECPKSLQRRMFKGIMVSGGSSSFKGYTTRVKKEVATAVEKSYGVAPVAADNDRLSPRTPRVAHLKDQIQSVQLSPVSLRRAQTPEEIGSPHTRFRKSVHKLQSIKLELDKMRDAEQLSHADSNFLDTPEPELVLVSPRSKRKKSRIVVKVKGLPREERAHAAWIGGSVLASVPETDGIWITKDEFFDQGAGIINSKCFSGHISLGQGGKSKTKVRSSEKAVVMDIGSSQARCGFASEVAPSVVVPTVYGKPKKSTSMSRTSIFIGDKAQAQRNLLSLHRPVHHGKIQNWDCMNDIWKYLYDKLAVEPPAHPLLMTEPTDYSSAERERIVQTVFEQFEVPAFYMVMSPALALLAKGKMTGLSVQSGATQTSIVPVYRGCPLTSAIKKIHVGGDDVDKALETLVQSK